MRARLAVSAVAAVVCATLLAGCLPPPEPSGEFITDERELQAISRVYVNAGSLRIVQIEADEPPRLDVSVDRAMTRYLMVDQLDDGRLRLGRVEGQDLRTLLWTKPPEMPVTFVLYTPTLTELGVDGASASANGWKGDSLTAQVTNGTLNLSSLNLRVWRCEITDATSNVTVTGVAEDQQVINRGQSYYSGTGLKFPDEVQ